jgi:hypothetical protein
VSGDWSAGLPEATTQVSCGSETHVMSWRDGRFRALAHPVADLEAERALAALAGQTCQCVELLDAWERHATDPRVLLLGPRAQDSHLALAHRQLASTRGVRPVATASSPPKRPINWGAQPTAGEDERIRSILDLDDPLPHRFVATVAAALADQAQDRAVAPALQAALYGRVLASLHRWTEGTPELALVMGGGERSLSRNPDGSLTAALPFSWITEVWARRLDVVDGEFTLAVAPRRSGTLELLTVDAAMTMHTSTLATP